MKKLKTSKELSTTVKGKSLASEIDKLAVEWMEADDACVSATKRKEQIRDELIAFVDANGGGEETVSSSRYSITAKSIKGSDRLDEAKVAEVLRTKYPKAYAECVTETTVYSINDAKLVQLAERGIVPDSVIYKNVIKGGNRGTRVTVKAL